MKLRLLAIQFLIVFSSFAQQDHYLLVGTYTSGKSEGIYVYKFSSNGTSGFVSSIKTSNPSYLAISADNKFVYAVNENSDSSRFTAGGSVASFSFDKKTGTLSELNKQSSGGKHPCYVAIDKTGKWLAASNYSSGNFAIMHLNKNGTADSLSENVQHNGSGPVKGRQEMAHVHSTTFTPDNKYLIVADLGIDKLMMYRFDAKKGKATPATPPAFNCSPGSGPRHFAFHPNQRFGYVMEELSGTITGFSYSNGKLKEIQHLSSHPDGYTGVRGSADIHVSPDGKFLYCSNRGESNTIGMFSIDQKTGKLTLVGHQSTMGSTPRNFNFDPSGNFLLVANQQSDNIVIFKRDKKTGLLTYTGEQIQVPNPVCIKWIPVK